MKAIFVIIYISSVCMFSPQSRAQNDTLRYPQTKKVNQLDTFFGYIIEDPYRWLEQQESEETKNWVKQQNKVTNGYLSKIPNNFSLREQIRRNTEIQYLTPDKKGDYYFVLMPKYGRKELSIYFRKNIQTDDWEELIIDKDLNIKKAENIDISEYAVSKNSKYIAYTFDTNGSDWKELKVADLEKQKSMMDHLYDIKHSDIVWRGNGFYYTRYERTNAEEQYKQLSVNGKLYYHTLGTTQEKDSIIFKKNNAPNNIFTPVISENERYLILEDHDPVKNTFAYYYFDFENKTQTALLPLFKKTPRPFKFLGIENDYLLFITQIKDDKKVIMVDPKNPLKWIEKIRSIEQLNLLDGFYYKDRLYQLCFYNQQEYIVVLDNKGNIIKKVELPVGSSCEFKGVDIKTNQLLISYGSYLHPPVYAGMDLSTFKFELLEQAKISYEMNDYEVHKVMYKSDTAYVPMLLMHRKNLKMDGNNPVLLEFYGGFGIITKASYDAGRISFIENGGIYAFAMIRGGREKGNYWYHDAILTKRQNSINDIINAAHYLIDNKYTNSSKIAISGSSHGGLMASAAAMQRPDLFGAVVSVVGESDMLRSEKFTVSSFHLDEFGSVKDSLMFLNLRSYSPLHNVKKGVKYPPIMFMTSDYDDRVPPLHSYKMVATMQELAAKVNPVLLRVEKNAGHDGARNYDTYLDAKTDFYSFILNALNVKKYK